MSLAAFGMLSSAAWGDLIDENIRADAARLPSRAGRTTVTASELQMMEETSRDGINLAFKQSLSMMSTDAGTSSTPSSTKPANAWSRPLVGKASAAESTESSAPERAQRKRTASEMIESNKPQVATGDAQGTARSRRSGAATAAAASGSDDAAMDSEALETPDKATELSMRAAISVALRDSSVRKSVSFAAVAAGRKAGAAADVAAAAATAELASIMESGEEEEDHEQDGSVGDGADAEEQEEQQEEFEMVTQGKGKRRRLDSGAAPSPVSPFGSGKGRRAGASRVRSPLAPAARAAEEAAAAAAAAAPSSKAGAATVFPLPPGAASTFQWVKRTASASSTGSAASAASASSAALQGVSISPAALFASVPLPARADTAASTASAASASAPGSVAAADIEAAVISSAMSAVSGRTAASSKSGKSSGAKPASWAALLGGRAAAAAPLLTISRANTDASVGTSASGAAGGDSSDAESSDGEGDDGEGEDDGASALNSSVMTGVTGKTGVEELTPERIEKKQKQKQKQIDIGKATPEYARYLEQVPKASRVPRCKAHPVTPDRNIQCATRAWNGQVRAWRRALHAYDPPKPATVQEQVAAAAAEAGNYAGSAAPMDRDQPPCVVAKPRRMALTAVEAPAAASV